MKSLCTVLPRVRSNSVSSPRLYSTAVASLSPSSPPPSRSLLSPTRLSIDPDLDSQPNHNHHTNNTTSLPFSLALTQPQSSSGPTLANANPQGQYALFPYSALNPPYYLALAPAPQPAPDPHPHPRPKRQRLKYQLDVGAYGIPKRCRAVPSPSRRPPSSASHQDLSLAVQVGEDAYFVRENAMGVADGVGGWSRSHSAANSSSSSTTPSALFARRLMHYCSAELDTASAVPLEQDHSLTHNSPVSGSHPPPPSRPCFSFTHHLKPRPTPSLWKWSSDSSTSLPTSFNLHSVFAEREPQPTLEQEDLQRDLEDELDELSEGIDVLQILEQAYVKSLKAHVIQPPDPSPPLPKETSSTSSSTETMPLLEGSSTALLAVLDHPPRPSTSSTSHKSPLATATVTATATASTTTTSSSSSSSSSLQCQLEECDLEAAATQGEYDAVIKIAHVGDCMGMLVRGEDIAWRSEEMWWDFNTPVQLGPVTSASVTPRNSAKVFTVPVKADDILILASDGLSDNLWDEDVLDEVLRFKKTFLTSPAADDSGSDSGYSSSTEGIATPAAAVEGPDAGMLKRKTLAGMLSEALCSRARRVSERRVAMTRATTTTTPDQEQDEVPFARRAREAGKRFGGGKNDDISVVVAVISPTRK